MCSECPSGGVGWETVGVISVAACVCPAGRYRDEVSGTCVECEAGTYKVRALTADSRTDARGLYGKRKLLPRWGGKLKRSHIPYVRKDKA